MVEMLPLDGWVKATYQLTESKWMFYVHSWGCLKILVYPAYKHDKQTHLHFTTTIQNCIFNKYFFLLNLNQIFKKIIAFIPLVLSIFLSNCAFSAELPLQMWTAFRQNFSSTVELLFCFASLSAAIVAGTHAKSRTKLGIHLILTSMGIILKPTSHCFFEIQQNSTILLSLEASHAANSIFHIFCTAPIMHKYSHKSMPSRYLCQNSMWLQSLHLCSVRRSSHHPQAALLVWGMSGIWSGMVYT